MSLISEITAQNYLKAIVKVCSNPVKKSVTTGEIARLLKVTPGTATLMVQKLERDGYLVHVPRQGCSPTAKGKKAGLAVLRRHRLIETFLTDVLKMDKKAVHREAEQLEHAASDSLIDKIDAFLNYPEQDPHGAVIPRKNQSEYSFAYICAADVAANTDIKISSLSGSEAQRAYYKSAGLKEGAHIRILEKHTKTDAAVIEVDGKKLPCSLSVLKNIFTEQAYPQKKL